MAWIKVDQSLLTHRKTLMLAEALEISEVTAAGHLVGLWTWALDNAPSGVLPSSARIIARAAHWAGDTDQLLFSLYNSGYLDCSQQGVYSLHNWKKYAGNLIRMRAANAKRMRAARDKKEG